MEKQKVDTGNRNRDLEGSVTDGGRDHKPADRGFIERRQKTSPRQVMLIAPLSGFYPECWKRGAVYPGSEKLIHSTDGFLALQG
ncbi:hypothetical protein V495_01246 [Pseudogymnoascus sp. VKM F-4514 (FW-929)]|nr:hypothetical protein V495_01246 [Pseudogymnoascus sp. VKM F-4514 (FW-929)]KFY54927.1 hypothetical protein V497_07337 [Pseudogymnoascus sp. VKM F-4516 (FW-969)]